MLLIAREITKSFLLEKNFLSTSQRVIQALDRVTFSLEKGEVLGIVGESGSGKTTLARIITHIIPQTSGHIQFGQEISQRFRDVQMIFQNPYESLDPKMTIQEALQEPLVVHKVSGDHLERIKKVLELVQLPPECLNRLPHQFSAGQRQKIVIARALILNPKLLICDEPTSSLDLSLQAQILNLLLDLKENLNLTLIFISHNLDIIKIISDRIMVMYSGIIVELGLKDIFVYSPAHPYTKLLLDLSKGGEEVFLKKGSNRKGCRYFEQCPYKQKRCKYEPPELIEISKGHWVNCFYPIKYPHE